MNSFGEYIRNKRKQLGLPLRNLDFLAEGLKIVLSKL
ncbi:hypothetical protein EZS27_012124 [termite gut metagenome]|uniref:HTH cro/C1-type domain-containing protein n=1 Tax=termite gut metagenome TaxID=433724 RepID=A0A5J4S438_9ZZZZ